MQQQYNCPGCKKQIGESLIRQHISLCKSYQAFTFNKIKRLNNTDNTDYLKFLSEELYLARQYIQQIIQNKRYEIPSKYQSKYSQKEELKVTKKHSMDLIENSNIFDQKTMVKCILCKGNYYTNLDFDRLCYVQQCWHLFCKKCLEKYIDKQFFNSLGNPKCPNSDCLANIPDYQVKQVLGSKFDQMQNKVMRKMFNLVQCHKCKQQYAFVPGNPNDAPKKDQHGKTLSSQSAIIYAQSRFMCPHCRTQQCKQCLAIPYHLGMSCLQFKKRSQMMKCRYCDTPITEKNVNKSSIPAHSNICNSKQCQDLAATACKKILNCSHPCSGVRNQKQCLPCLKQGCCEKNQQLHGQTGDDYCNICFVESLQASPSIRCGCGHIFHLKCVKKRFQIKWLTPRILFNFCHCPLCKKWIEIPPQNQLYKQNQQNKALYEKIKKMASERLKFQELQKDEKLTDKKSPYYGKPNQYAMAIYAYFMCFKCKNPYFGGRKNCAQAMNQQNVQGYNPSQLICANCCQIPIQNCPKHGKQFIEFKCKYCCSTAQWFCWGNTHFCEPCHKRQCQGDYVSKYPKQKLPICPGKGKCPIGGDHGGNGQQKMLGCAICRNFKENHKSF